MGHSKTIQPLWVQLKERCIVDVEERIARGLWEVQSSHGFLLGTEDKRRELASARAISWEQRKKKVGKVDQGVKQGWEKHHQEQVASGREEGPGRA